MVKGAQRSHARSERAALSAYTQVLPLEAVLRVFMEASSHRCD